MIICRNEKELEKALENKEHRIILEGPKAAEIVNELEKARLKGRLARNTGWGIGLLCLLAAPFTAGGSLLGLGATAGVIALSDTVIAAIIAAIVSISVAAINAIKEYKIRKLEADRIELIRK